MTPPHSPGRVAIRRLALAAIVAGSLLPVTAAAQKRPAGKSTGVRELMARLDREGNARMDSLETVFRLLVAQRVVRAHNDEVAGLREQWRSILTGRSAVDSAAGVEGIDQDSLNERRVQVVGEATALIARARAILNLYPEVEARFGEEFPAVISRTIREQLTILRSFDARLKNTRRGSDAEELREKIGDLAGLDTNRWQLRLMTDIVRRSYLPALLLDSTALRNGPSVDLVQWANRTRSEGYELDFARALVNDELERWNREYWRDRVAGYRTRIESVLSPADRAGIDSLRRELATRIIGTHWDDGEGTEKLFDAVAQITRSHRASLAPVGGTVLKDIVAYNDLFPDHAAAIIDRHREELGGDLIDVLYEEMLTMVSMNGSQSGPEWVTTMYPELIEPGLLLSGADDLLNLGLLSPLTRQVGWEYHGSLAIDSISALSAARTVTLLYSIAEADSSVTLTLYDAKGNPKGSFPQGAKPAGRYEALLDLAAIPDGLYLCALTLGDANPREKALRLLRLAR